MTAGGQGVAACFRREIVSTTDAVETACVELRAFLNDAGLGTEAFGIELVARELLVNAVKHGNGFHAERRARMRLAVGRRWLTLRVTDEGKGFDWRAQRRIAVGRRHGHPRARVADWRELRKSPALQPGRQRGHGVVREARRIAEDEMSEGYTIGRQDALCSVRLEGDLTAALVPGLQSAVRQEIAAGASQVEVDLGQAVMLDSSGIGLLIAISNTLGRSGGRIAVVNASKDIARLLQTMRLSSRLNVREVRRQRVRSEMDDGLLNEFINESREHLATIEVDLLSVEEGGADIDEELVNKVFRAAHSIKGGSGFFGLARVKELSHRAETVLDMLRSRRMAPNAEIINVLLAAFDRLREMINDASHSESIEIDDLVVSLTGLASSYLPTAEKSTLVRDVVLQSASGWTITVPEVDLRPGASQREVHLRDRVRPDLRRRTQGQEHPADVP